MKSQWKRFIICGGAAGLIVALAMGGIDFSRRSRVAHAQATPQMSEAAFKNIQVLKGITVDEFMGTMGLFSAALSVCCGDCHTGAGTSNPKWEDDAPPQKKIARRMVEMVNAINKANFNGRQMVTCWTCHRGNQSPATTPTIDAIYSTPVFTPADVLPTANPATAGTPPADQILDKYVQALGGAAALAKLTSYTATGETLLYDEARTYPMEVYAKAPGLLATYVREKEGDLARTWDGRDAWAMLPLTVVGEYPLTASAKEGARLDAQLAFPGGLKSFFTNWKVSFPATIDGNDVYVLQATGANGMLATFYFDKKTGLMTRAIHYAASAMGRVPTQIDYSDYRPVAGVMMPYKYTYGWVSGREEYTVKEIKANVAVDNSKFAKPVQRAK
jgi:hypothetical protein